MRNQEEEPIQILQEAVQENEDIHGYLQPDYYEAPGIDALRYRPDQYVAQGGGHSRKKQCCVMH